MTGGNKMFRKMRRFKQQLEDSDSLEVLKNGHRGTLSLIGDDGYPYGVPINYFLGEDGHIYMHCAAVGHKIDALKKCDKASFTVLEDQPKEEGDFALYVKSVVVFGRISMVEDREKVLKSAMSLADHIYPEQKEFYKGDLERNRNTVQILEITPEHITGKKVHER